MSTGFDRGNAIRMLSVACLHACGADSSFHAHIKLSATLLSVKLCKQTIVCSNGTTQSKDATNVT